jgi:hypothetical protein
MRTTVRMHQRLKLALAQPRVEGRHVQGEGRGVLVGIDVDEPAPRLDLKFEEPIVARIEPFRRPEVARIPKPPVERVHPAVIPADQRPAAIPALFLEQMPGTMPAHIVKRFEPLRRAHDE